MGLLGSIVEFEYGFSLAVVRPSMLNPSSVAAPKSVDPLSALTALVNQDSSGRVVFQAPGNPSLGWRVHFSNGQIHYATALQDQHQRLSYLLPYLLPTLQLPVETQGWPGSDYKFLCQCWQSQQLTTQQIRRAMVILTQEALTYLFAMPTALMTVESTIGLDPILISVALDPLVESIRGSVQEWQAATAGVVLPTQAFQVHDLQRLIHHLRWEEASPEQEQLAPAVLAQLTTAPLCFYTAAQLLGMNLLALMAKMQPLIELGVVSLVQPSSPEAVLDQRPLIACIDDSKTMRAIIRSILEPAGYRVMEIFKATEAVAHLMQARPDLILLDISMPDVDGYELCGTLKRSSLRQIPVVMVTGREGVVDRVRARFAGATDYITKPFDPEHLTSLVHHLVTG